MLVEVTAAVRSGTNSTIFFKGLVFCMHFTPNYFVVFPYILYFIQERGELFSLFLFLFVKKYYFLLVSESWGKIQLLEPP